MGALRKGPAPRPPAQPSVTSSHEAGTGTQGTRANPAAVAPRRLERLGGNNVDGDLALGRGGRSRAVRGETEGIRILNREPGDEPLWHLPGTKPLGFATRAATRFVSPLSSSAGGTPLPETALVQGGQGRSQAMPQPCPAPGCHAQPHAGLLCSCCHQGPREQK